MLADHMDAGLGDRYLAADGAVTGVGEIDGRTVAIAAYDFTVMAGSMGAVGEDKIAPHARARAAPAHPDGLAARLGRRAHPVDERLDVRRRRRPVPRAGRDERRRADGRGDARPLRGRHRVHPGARRLRADGEGHVVDGARRSPPREGRGRRGRHRGGDGRLGRPHEESAASPTSRSPTTRSASASCASTCRSSRSTTASRRRSRDRAIPSTGGSRSSTTSCRPRRGARTTCARSSRAIVDDGDLFWMKPEWAKNIVTGFARVGGQPVGIVANQPMVLGGALDVNAADKAARFVWLCDAFNIPLVFLHDVPGFIVGSRGREAGHHPPRRQDAVRGERGDGAEDQRDPAQELRRRLLRDERARVRGRLHRRVADGRDRGDGSRRRGQHHPPQARSRRSPTKRSATRSGSSSPRRSAPTSTRTSRPATPSSTTSSIPPRHAPPIVARPRGISARQARSTGPRASTACSPSDVAPVPAIARASCELPWLRSAPRSPRTCGR